jgi:hypothetical protein
MDQAGQAGDDVGSDTASTAAGTAASANSVRTHRRTWEEMDRLRARMVREGFPLPELTATENERVWRSLTGRRRRPQLQALLGISDGQIDQALARMHMARLLLRNRK